jgi:phosphate starvation-inducible PhoH-like protein
MTKNHDLYNLALRDKKMYPVVAYGSAGTGKTYGAVAAAYEAISNKHVQQIIVTRPNVSFAEKSGFLPGTEREKMEPWIRPILQHLEKFARPFQLQAWEEKGKLVFYPLEYIQGMTFDNAFIIVDECQNMTFEQLKVMLTRIGEWSKLVLCGDVAQISPKFAGSGLAKLIKMVDKMGLPVHTIEFDRNDIVRSDQCRMWIEAFEDFEKVENV